MKPYCPINVYQYIVVSVASMLCSFCMRYYRWKCHVLLHLVWLKLHTRSCDLFVRGFSR